MTKQKTPKKKASAAEKPADWTQVRDAEVRRAHAKFIRNPPHAYLSAGAYDVPKADIEAAEKLPVPDGRYRIVGLDPIYEFKGGKLIAVTKGGPYTDPTDLVEVP